ncbi:hypothetical protein BDZ89DRAFT_1034484 [Hymenopellis radicata]|nr:hypothetical protein BDZ89DRAFT_1034484 [Hymenopellis radicata]
MTGQTFPRPHQQRRRLSSRAGSSHLPDLDDRGRHFLREGNILSARVAVRAEFLAGGLTAPTITILRIQPHCAEQPILSTTCTGRGPEFSNQQLHLPPSAALSILVLNPLSGLQIEKRWWLPRARLMWAAPLRRLTVIAQESYPFAPIRSQTSRLDKRYRCLMEAVHSRASPSGYKHVNRALGTVPHLWLYPRNVQKGSAGKIWADFDRLALAFNRALENDVNLPPWDPLLFITLNRKHSLLTAGDPDGNLPIANQRVPRPSAIILTRQGTLELTHEDDTWPVAGRCSERRDNVVLARIGRMVCDLLTMSFIPPNLGPPRALVVIQMGLLLLLWFHLHSRARQPDTEPGRDAWRGRREGDTRPPYRCYCLMVYMFFIILTRFQQLWSTRSSREIFLRLVGAPQDL